jgi:hypothetical protein
MQSTHIENIRQADLAKLGMWQLAASLDIGSILLISNLKVLAKVKKYM